MMMLKYLRCFVINQTIVRKFTYFSFKGDPIETASVTKYIKLAAQNLEILFAKWKLP